MPTEKYCEKCEYRNLSSHVEPCSICDDFSEYDENITEMPTVPYSYCVERKYLKHQEIANKLNAIYRAKNADYGDTFGKGFKEYGSIMPVIRLEDKLNRLKQLTLSGKQEVKDESIIDTLLDLANYAIMTVIEMEGAKERKANET